MSGSCEKQPPSEKPKRRRRWLQISVRSLLVVMTLAAIGAAAWRWYEEPFRRQRQAMTVIERAGGTYQTVAAGPAWLRRLFGEGRFQNITLVNVADCDDPAAYIHDVSSLPALETLVVGGAAFTDEHLLRLGEVTTLTGLVLDSTSVTTSGLAAIGVALPGCKVFESERRNSEAIDWDKHAFSISEYKMASHALREVLGDPSFLASGIVRQLGDRLFLQPSGVRFHRSPSETDFAHLARLKHVERIVFEGFEEGDAGLERFGRFPELKGLFLTASNITDAGLAHLAALTRLERLGLGRTPITNAGMVHLAALHQLEYLDLSHTQVNDAGLANLQFLSRLNQLNLTRTPITGEGLRHVQGPVAGARRLRGLSWLDLRLTKIDDAAVAHLKVHTSLRFLFLSSTEVGDAGLAHLKGLTNMHHLSLDGTKISDAGLAHLADMLQLRVLALDHTYVSDTGLVHLRGLKGLEQLSLLNTQVGDAGLAHLAALSKLGSLNLARAPASDAALAHLKKMKNLRGLGLPATKVTPKEVNELQQSLPACRISLVPDN